MNELQLAKVIENLFPQLVLNEQCLELDWGNTVVLSLNGNDFKYLTYNTGGRGGNIGKIYNYIENEAALFCMTDLHSFEMEKNYVERMIATKWLDLETEIDQQGWEKIIDIIERLQKRTYENQPIIKNIIIDINVTGIVDISEYTEAKLVDVMAGSNYTYFVTDKELKLFEYKSINWKETDDKHTYSSIPNFLQPFVSALGSDSKKVGISVTHAGDIIVYKNTGMLVSIRKGSYTIYDDATVKNLYRDVLSGTGYGVICNLFDVCWDISYRRHGALVVVVTDKSYQNHIVNKESILGHMQAKGIRKELVSSIKKVSLKQTGHIENRSIFLELASVDGAVIVEASTGTIEAFGSIIETAKSIQGTNGARTTAAKSAIRYDNMMPIRISSDGDIVLYRKANDILTGEVKFLEYRFL